MIQTPITLIEIARPSPYVVPGLKLNSTMQMNENELMADILRCTGLTEEQLLRKTRAREIVLARQVFMWILRTRRNYTFKRIGSFLKRDHTTAMYAYYTIRDLIHIKDPEILHILKQLKILI